MRATYSPLTKELTKEERELVLKERKREFELKVQSSYTEFNGMSLSKKEQKQIGTWSNPKHIHSSSCGHSANDSRGSSTVPSCSSTDDNVSVNGSVSEHACGGSGEHPQTSTAQSLNPHRHHCASRPHGDGNDFWTDLGYMNELLGSYTSTALFLAFIANFIPQKPSPITPFGYKLYSVIVGAVCALLPAYGSAYCHNIMEVLNNTSSTGISQKSADKDTNNTPSSFWLALILGADAVAHIAEFTAFLFTVATILKDKDIITADQLYVVISIFAVAGCVAIVPEVSSCYLSIIKKHHYDKKEAYDESQWITPWTKWFSEMLNTYSALFKTPTTFASIVTVFVGILDPLFGESTKARGFDVSIYAVIISCALATALTITYAYGAAMINDAAHSTISTDLENPISNDVKSDLDHVSEQSKLINPCKDLTQFVKNFQQLSVTDRVIVVGRTSARGCETFGTLGLLFLFFPHLPAYTKTILSSAFFITGGTMNFSDARLLAKNIEKYREKTGRTFYSDFTESSKDCVASIKKIGFACFSRCPQKSNREASNSDSLDYSYHQFRSSHGSSQSNNV